jgi:mannose-6-phosphate isomerase-like protein (cupin superfamily)
MSGRKNMGGNMLRAVRNGVVGVFVFSAAVAAQNPTSATYISGADIKAAKESAAFRIVDTGKNYVGLGVQHRPKAEKGKAGNPLEHSSVTEAYIVTEGSATLATGGTLTDGKVFPTGDDGKYKDNGEGIGPGLSGKVAEPNQVRQIVPGDVIIIPAGVSHWFEEVQENLTYLVVRIDSAKVITLK